MSFRKIGELIEIGPENIQNIESIAINAEILESFSKFASNLKKIAPKAEDFLYFSAMMHSAEASGLNDDGTPRLTSKGQVVNVGWDKSGGTWRWKSNDPKIKPYKNSNGDIFPEEELVKAHKKWVGKPLCIDHKSSSVDHVRGFIVDTYYDRVLKRVIALCALDKFNYPDLARKVATGYSNSVSMGTAVGTAICSDCGTKAKVEADFCKCMRGRTCYGEINVDLNPIELSIVVNGADPQAKIKHIIAAANNMATYVEQKEKEFNKIATESFSATLSYNKDGETSDFGRNTDNQTSGTMSFQADSLDKLKADIDKALEDISKISEEYKENMSQNTNDGALSQTHSSASMQESDLESTDSNIAPPAARFASQEESSVGIESQLRDITAKLETMQENLNKLANSEKQEEIMSGNKENLNKKGYFQGAGGVNEPTPGQTKYEKDPLNEELRNNEDRQMVGAKPFPEVGSVDGLMGDDLDRKKMLARAEAEERAVKRAAIVSKAKARLEQTKEAYFQGAPESDPAKVLPYAVDKLNTDLRDKSDKHMVGQKPFPEVGKVDGLHPSPDSADEKDELKRKEKLLRAALKARFVKAAKADGSHDAGNSAWEVYLGDKLLLTASVDDITGGRSESLYTAVATKEYGSELIGKVRKLGADKVAAGFAKSAQDAAPAPAPEAAPEAAAPAGLDQVATDTGKEGDQKENALELAESVRDLTSDLVESVRALTGEQAEMGNLDAMNADDSSDENKVSTAALFKMRKELNSELLSAMKESVATLTDHEKELRTIANMYEKGAVNETNKDLVTSLVGEAVSETKEAMAESYKLLSAFVKYARGTDAIVKRAQAEALTKENGEKMAPEHDSLMAMVDKGSSVGSASDTLDALLAEDIDSADVAEETEEDMGSADADENNAGQVMTNDPAKAKEMSDKGMDVKVTASLNTRANRDIARAKLAAEMKFHPLLDVAHEHLVDPKFDTKTPEGHFETLEERHEAMMDFATTPVKVRKEAEAIHTLVSEGKLDAADVDTLESHGVDPDAVKYYKQFWGQAGSEGSQFATELVKEHAKAELENQMTQYRVKLARAYELTYEMIDRDLLARTKEAVNNQVNEVMKWNDESFESVKKVIASQKPAIRKEASGRMPQVGFIGLEDAPSNGSDLASQLNLAFSSNKKRLF